MDSDSSIAYKELLQDFWKRINGVEKVFRKKDIKKLYNDRPLSESELKFLHKNYNDSMRATLSTDSSYSVNNYITEEEIEDLMNIIRKLDALGLINSSMTRIEALAIVMKYKDSKCSICEEITLRCCSCKTVKYCSEACQKDDWKNHKKVCTSKLKKNKS